METMNKKGFTLAEVLITLGIIGVVAAMTIPSLMYNYQKTQWATTLKKEYSTMVTACERILTEENANNLKETKFIRNAINPDADNKDLTQITTYFKIKGNPEKDGTTVKFSFSDGSLVSLQWNDELKVSVDVNGNKNPNKAGLDQFAFLLDDKCNNIIQIGKYCDEGADCAEQHFLNVMNNNWKIK